MAEDWADRLLERWSALHPEFETGPIQVTARISRIALHLTQRQQDVFARYGLNRGEVGVLSALRTVGPPHRLSPTRLFRGLMLSSAGLTSRLDRLEQRGLVARSHDPSDRRGILVDLTDEGRRVVDQAVAANIESERALLAGLGGQETETLGRLLRKLLAGLEPPADA